MLRLFLAGQLLLLLAQPSLAAGSDANSSATLLHRSKRSLFSPNANCPDPIYLTQSQVAAWPGITVDTSQITIFDDTSKLNLFKCSDDTFFVYTHLPTVMTRANWWLACGPTMSNGWRVRDAGGKNTAYGVIPVGCVKPTCTGLQLFDGSEFVLASYPTYQIVPNQPSLIGINQKFQFTCPLGSTIGIADSSATISLDDSMKITCEAEGWWMRTSSNLNGQLLTAKVGCIKTIPALPPAIPTQCQTGITYVAAAEKMTNGGWYYGATTDKAVIANGKWTLLCSRDSFIGYAATATALTLDATTRITCESTGWWIKTGSNGVGNALPAVKVGCFLKQTPVAPCAGTSMLLLDGSESAIPSAYQFIPTVPSTVGGKLEFACPAGATVGYALGDSRLLVEPLKITCEATGWWAKSPNRVDGLLPAAVKVGCFKELPTSTPPAPVSAIPKQACGCWYEPSTCKSCDLQKLFVLDGQGAMSGRCTLGCGKGYVFEGGDMNMISCEGGYWLGSSKAVNNVTVALSGPMGYIITSCVPEPAPAAACSLTPTTFDCLGCDATKLIPLTPTRSKTGCVLSCDKNFRLLVQDASGKVSRAQEIVADQGSFTVYPLGSVKNPITISSAGVKLSCELATTDPTVPIILNPACTGIQLFDGSEPVISANGAAYQFIPTIPSLVGGKLEFVCPSDAAIGYAQGETRLSVEPLKITCEASGWWVKSPNRVDGLLGAVRVGCFRELPSNAVTAPASTIPKTACGCWYEPSSCRSCDLQKLTVLDGVGLSGRCTLGCAKDYVFEGGEMNIISCEGGYWFGSSRITANATVPLAGPFGYITTSCVPAPTPATCSLQFSTFDCYYCDTAKVVPVSSTKSKAGCVLSCDKGYRLLVLDANLKVTRAQEVVADTGAFTVYPLGTVKNPITIPSTGVKFSCELVTIDPTSKVILGVAPPPPPTEPCGCPYTLDVSNPAYDSTKLFLQDTGPNSCHLQCDKGYRLVGAKSSATCLNGTWTYQSADSITRWPSDGKFSCEPAPATCARKHNSNDQCKAGMTCTTAPLFAIKGDKSDCILTCGKGYRLIETAFNNMTGRIYQEAWFIAEKNQWQANIIGELGLSGYGPGLDLTFTCERYYSPAEKKACPVLPVTDPLPNYCGRCSAPATRTATEYTCPAKFPNRRYKAKHGANYGVKSYKCNDLTGKWEFNGNVDDVVSIFCDF